MNSSAGRASAASRDPYLTLRRVERQQHLIERLHTSSNRLTLGHLANELGVTERTVARDVERLRHSGVPITVVPGRGGGVSIERATPSGRVELDLPEIAALGPSASESAASAMRKLTAALRPG